MLPICRLKASQRKSWCRNRRRRANLSPDSRTIPVPSRRWCTRLPFRSKRAAPDMQTEIDTIDAFERDAEKKPANDWRREQDRGPLRSVLRLIWFNWDVFTDRPLSLTEGIALEVALEQIKLFLFQQIHEDFGKP